MLGKVASCCLILSLVTYSAAEIYAIRRDTQFYYEEFEDVAASFGGKLPTILRGMMTYAEPADACDTIAPPPPPPGTAGGRAPNESGKWIVLVARYTEARNCSFAEKVRMAQKAGYHAVVVHNVRSNQLVAMTADNDTGITIPSVFVSESSGMLLHESYCNADYYIIVTPDSSFNLPTHLLIPFSIVVGICFIVMVIFMIVKYIKDRRRQRRHRLPTSTLNKIPICKFQKGDPYETCAICLDDYVEGEKLRVLPCNHAYHSKCIDPWLTKNRRVCPVCKRKVFAQDEAHHYSDSESDADDTTPLINSNSGTQGGTFQPQRQNPFMRAVRSISQQSGAGNFVTASDRHSINGEYHDVISSSSSSSSSSSDSSNVARAAPRREPVLDDSLDVVVQPNNTTAFRQAVASNNPFEQQEQEGQEDAEETTTMTTTCPDNPHNVHV